MLHKKSLGEKGLMFARFNGHLCGNPGQEGEGTRAGVFGPVRSGPNARTGRPAKITLRPATYG